MSLPLRSLKSDWEDIKQNNNLMVIVEESFIIFLKNLFSWKKVSITKHFSFDFK